MNQQGLCNDIDEFLSLTVRSGLVESGELDRLTEAYRTEYLPSVAMPDTITSLCTFLISRGVLTPWQYDKLRRGKWKGFFLGGFVLLDSLGYDDQAMYCLARDVRDGRYFKLAILPKESKGEDLAFRIHERMD